MRPTRLVIGASWARNCACKETFPTPSANRETSGCLFARSGENFFLRFRCRGLLPIVDYRAEQTTSFDAHGRPRFLSGGKNCTGKWAPVYFYPYTRILSNLFVLWLARRLWILHEFHGTLRELLDALLSYKNDLFVFSFSRKFFILTRDYVYKALDACVVYVKTETHIWT